jgi:RHS repeat-associated protein
VIVGSRPVPAVHKPLIVAVVATLVAAMVGQTPAFARQAPGYDTHRIPSVPVAAIHPATPAARAGVTAPAPAPVVWPSAGAASVDVLTGTGRAGTLPVRVAGVSGATTRSAAANPAQVRVEVLGQDQAAKARQQGLLLRLNRTDGGTGTGRVRLTVDYSSFGNAYGGDWANRLRLVALPDCALDSPGKQGCTATPLPSVNDPHGHTVAADVTTTSTASTFAVTAAATGGAGDYSASPIAATSSWKAGSSTGEFTWSYPITVPPSPVKGFAPQVALAYSSASVDGLSAATNNQPSWVGQGFQYGGGSIVRSYRSCAEDTANQANNDASVGDLCWGSDNATLTLNGSSTELVKNGAADEWHLRNDDGSKVEHLTGASNGARNGEYWKVTTTTGVQYWFGRNRLPGWTSGKPETQSTWTEPVAGNQSGEPCHATDFASSFCTQAYSWNLDYVVDPHGNTASYWYAPETGYYAKNKVTATPVSYIRGGSLQRIDYGTWVADVDTGTDTDYTSSAAAQIVFTTADRCLSSCATHDKTHWPDVPWDQNCTSGTNCVNISPTFWSTVRLTGIKTRVLTTGTSYRDVDSYALRQSFPDPGDGTQAGLWLDGVTHTGVVDGGSVADPEVTFEGYQMPNRVDTDGAQPLMNWRRMWKIHNEYGGVLSVTYSDPDCVPNTRMPSAPESNTLLCYPVYWTPGGPSTLRLEWFQKYVVKLVRQTDGIGGAPPVDTSYDYANVTPGAVMWHYNDEDGLTPENRKTWASWRGYEKVTTHVGAGPDQITSEDRFFRGMNGDHLPGGGTRSVSIADDEGNSWPDEEAYAGENREHIVYNGTGVVSATVNDMWQSAPTSTRTISGFTVSARHSGVATVHGRTALDAGRGWRRSSATTTFDGYGMTSTVDDQGDLAVDGDEQCTRTFYDSRNASAWIVGVATRTQVTAQRCSATPVSETDVISDTRTSFDGHAYGAPATKGDPTTTEVASAWTPAQTTWVTTARTGYDTYGRVVDTYDALGNHTNTTYTKSVDGRTERVAVIDAMNFTTTTDNDLAWGTAVDTVDANGKRTDIAHDAAGRITQVWLPTRSKANGDTPNTVYAYTLRTNGSSATTTQKLNAAGVYTTTYTLFDGLGRTRQTQAPSPSASGGRILSDTIYNSAGLVSLAYANYYNSGAPSVDLVGPTDPTLVTTQTATLYDQAGRTTASVFQPKTAEAWRTTTYYGGDHTDTTPPAGGTPTTSVTDARGHGVKLLQYTVSVADYHNAAAVAAANTTTYVYNTKSQLASVTDQAGNQWLYTYDLRGRKITTKNPDAARATTTTYDDNGNVTSTTDPLARKVWHTYDALSRPLGLYDNDASGAKRATWTYDTVAGGKGKPASETRWVGTSAYVTAVTGYDNAYNVTGNTVTIPAVEGTQLATTYTSHASFKVDGSPDTLTYPAAGDLQTETLFYGYDNVLGLQKKLTTLYGSTSASYVTDTAYDELGRKVGYTRSTASSGVPTLKQSFTFDDLTGRLSRSHTVRSAATPSDVTDKHYTYTDSGTVSGIADTPAGSTADVQCFTQDTLQRMTEAWTPASGNCAAAPSASLGGPAPYWQTWTYDAIGDRLQQVDHNTTNGVATSVGSYPAAQATGPHAPSSVSTTDGTGTHVASYTYDDDGHTLTRPDTSGTQSFVWDAEDRLTSVTEGSATTSYVYDVSGDRLVAHNVGSTTVYLPGMEVTLNTSTHVVKATRTYQGEAVRTGAGLSWLINDEHGTPEVAVNATTQQVIRRLTTPFGSVRGSAPGSWPDDHGFVGGLTDPTGLVHLGAREYDPAVGRFISGDPVIKLDQPQTLNPYEYGNNNPASFSDPTGTSWLSGLTKTLKACNNGATWAGIGMMVLGAAMDVGGGALVLSGVGAPLGAALIIGGAEVVEAGAVVATAGIVAGCATNVMNNYKSGDSGGGGDDSPPPKKDPALQNKFAERAGNEKKAIDQADEADKLQSEWKNGDEGYGTVAVVRIFDRVTGTYEEVATVNGDAALPGRMGGQEGTALKSGDKLNNGMRFVKGNNPARHAEQNAVDEVKRMNTENAKKGGSSDRYQITEGGTSRRICDTNCAPDIENSGDFTFGPRKGGGIMFWNDVTPFRYFFSRNGERFD